MKAGRSTGFRGRRREGVALALLMVALALLSCGVPLQRDDLPRGVYHRVKPGETLSAIARAYRVDMQELAEINNIRDVAQIDVDRVIFVPDATQILDALPAVRRPTESIPPRAEMAPPSQETRKARIVNPVPLPVSPKAAAEREMAATDRRMEKTPPRERRAGGGEAPTGPSAAAPAKQPETPKTEPVGGRDEGKDKGRSLTFDRKRFIWPVKGKVISQFGMQPNRMYFNGIRIAAPAGTAVLAAAAGTVDVSNTFKGYGETIIILHDDHYATVYAHLGTRTVGAKTRVGKGDRIAFLSDGKQGEAFVHFEIRHKNKARNPLFFLP